MFKSLKLRIILKDYSLKIVFKNNFVDKNFEFLNNKLPSNLGIHYAVYVGVYIYIYNMLLSVTKKCRDHVNLCK